jgi:hypothetical protein
MPTLAQELRSALTSLDRTNVDDLSYRNLFSSFTKTRLRPGETWRLRLLQWCEREELYEALCANEIVEPEGRATCYTTAFNNERT